jgi:anthranilate phosphoribosyltransferase
MISQFSKIADGYYSTKELIKIIPSIKIDEDSLYEATKVYRERMITIESPEGTMDVCGTGGSGKNNLNVSTAIAFIVAAFGIPVAKHGNNAASSMCGSSDVLHELGIKINLTKEEAEDCLMKNNLVFLHAPCYHPAFKYVSGARRELGVKTIFNYLGPLLNPAEVKYQIVGCSDINMGNMLMNVAKRLGSKGCCLIKENYTCIEGGDSRYNAKKLVDLLRGEKSVYREIVINQSAIAIAVNHNFTIQSIKQVEEVIDSGKAYELYKKLKTKLW